jgi:hypothetical protein
VGLAGAAAAPADRRMLWPLLSSQPVSSEYHLAESAKLQWIQCIAKVR